jgi:hypothetical protein
MIYDVQHNGKGKQHLLMQDGVPLCKTKAVLNHTCAHELEVNWGIVVERFNTGRAILSQAIAAPYIEYCSRCLKIAAKREALK